jgi:hypothetical protein
VKDSKTSGDSPESCGNSVSFPEHAGESLDNSPPIPASQDPNFLSKHGISQRVADQRPYLIWTSPEELKTYCRDLPMGARQHASKVANQSPTGIIICRSFGGGSLGDVNPVYPLTYLPELRPDEPVVTSGHWQAHPTIYPTRDNWPTYPTTGKPLAKRFVLEFEKAEAHIKKHHGGVNVEDVHWTPSIGKYVFFPGKGARMIDVHPSALPSLFTARRIYFGMEGCLKADAMYSYLEATGQDDEQSVISGASVTLCDADELVNVVELFLTFVYRTSGLPSPEIVLVPDADHSKNPLVRQQALLLRSTLRRLGLAACIAAPPPCTPGKGRHTHPDCLDPDAKCPWNGVDDYLAAPEFGGCGGSLEDLVVLDREAPNLDAWALDQNFRHGHKIDRVQRDRRFMEALILHSANEPTSGPFGLEEGQFHGSIRSVARATGLSKDAANRAANGLVEIGELEADPYPFPRTTRKYRNPKTGKYVTPWAWEDNPTFTVPKELRVSDSFKPLGASTEETTPLTTMQYHALSAKIDSLSEKLDLALGRVEETAVKVVDRFPNDPRVANAAGLFLVRSEDAA